MKILEITFREVDKDEAIEALIREKAAKLDQVCMELMGCRVAVERPQQHQSKGNPFRVRIDLTVPGEELVVSRESDKGDRHDSLPKVIRDAFDAARRRLKEYSERQRGEVRTRPQREPPA